MNLVLGKVEFRSTIVERRGQHWGTLQREITDVLRCKVRNTPIIRCAEVITEKLARDSGARKL